MRPTLSLFKKYWPFAARCGPGRGRDAASVAALGYVCASNARVTARSRLRECVRVASQGIELFTTWRAPEHVPSQSSALGANSICLLAAQRAEAAAGRARGERSRATAAPVFGGVLKEFGSWSARRRPRSSADFSSHCGGEARATAGLGLGPKCQTRGYWWSAFADRRPLLGSASCARSHSRCSCERTGAAVARTGAMWDLHRLRTLASAD